MNLYVIIGETGEYSDRNDWVAGVFDNRETAERMVIEKSAAARECRLMYYQWLQKQYAIRARWPISIAVNAEREIQDAIEKEVGPPPTGEPGDRFYLVEAPLNQWGQFHFVGDENHVDT